MFADHFREAAAPPPRLITWGAAALAAPIRLQRWLLELLIREVLAPVLTLPALLITEVIFIIRSARVRSEQRLLKARAQVIELAFDSTITTTVRQFERLQTALAEVEQRHASLDPRFAETLETSRIAYEATIEQLKQAASQVQTPTEIYDQVETIFYGPRR